MGFLNLGEEAKELYFKGSLLPIYDEFESENTEEILKELKVSLKKNREIKIKLSEGLGNELFKKIGINETFSSLDLFGRPLDSFRSGISGISGIRSTIITSVFQPEIDSYPITLWIDTINNSFFIIKKEVKTEIALEMAKVLMEEYAKIISNRKIEIRIKTEEMERIEAEKKQKKIEKEQKLKAEQEKRAQIEEEERLKNEKKFNDFFDL